MTARAHKPNGVATAAVAAALALAVVAKVVGNAVRANASPIPLVTRQRAAHPVVRHKVAAAMAVGTVVVVVATVAATRPRGRAKVSPIRCVPAST